MKVLLIISQYRWSRHMFIVEYPDNEGLYFKQARYLIEELENYKRSENNQEPTSYGDMNPISFTGAGRRYNVNDAGDIYFIPCNSINHAMCEIKSYWMDSQREARGKKRQSEVKSIFQHHSLDIIKGIIERRFLLI